MATNKITTEQFKKLVKQIIEEEKTERSIIGKRVGQVFQDISGINVVANKVITYSKIFDGDSDFGNINKAKGYLEYEGYDYGSMYMDYPIPFVVKGKTGVDNSGNTMIITKFGEERPLMITKYDSLNRENWDEMDGCLISKNFRGDAVYVIFFVFPD